MVVRTLYQCFFTLPSVRFGNSCETTVSLSRLRAQAVKVRTLAMSLHVLPWSLIALSLFSSAGVHGVLVLDFFGGGWPASSGAGFDGPAAADDWAPVISAAGWRLGGM